MNRELKFRVWDESLPGYAPIECVAGFMWKGPPDTGDEYLHLGKEGFVVEQFTGLSDRNGTEIYEGDIWRIQTGSCFFQGVETPSYRVGAVSIDTCGVHLGRCAKWANAWIGSGVGEVIGNIHESPELLQED